MTSRDRAARSSLRVQARETLTAWITQSGVEHEIHGDELVVVVLPGENKQRTAVAITIGEHHVTVQAFIARRPEENQAALHQWLLERNRSTFAVAYCVDHLGDIYLSGRLPHEAFSEDSWDLLLGALLAEADSAFNAIVAMGFTSAIRAEWQWRLSRGEPTDNLRAFEHLRPDSLN